ncbi:MAG: serine hydrolase, partial [Maribacter sp.]
MKRKLFVITFFVLSGGRILSQEIIPDKIVAPSLSALDNSQSSEVDLLSVNPEVDSIITDGIKNKAFPGAQVLVAEKGNIIFHKAYGFHTYDSVQSVGLNDLYDLASVTKILGPLPA